MIKRTYLWTMLVLGATLPTAVAGCAADEAAGVDTLEAPAAEADDDTLGERQLVTTVNAAGTWTASASVVIEQQTCKPSFSWYGTASADFTGPSGSTRKMGVCALRQFKTSTGGAQACNTDADCLNAPTTLPSGGYRYCVAPNATGAKSCFYRPGPQGTYCAGSPANGGVPVAPGTYSVGFQPPGATKWISYACFEGCLASDPSSSSAASGTIQEQWC